MSFLSAFLCTGYWFLFFLIVFCVLQNCDEVSRHVRATSLESSVLNFHDVKETIIHSLEVKPQEDLPIYFIKHNEATRQHLHLKVNDSINSIPFMARFQIVSAYEISGRQKQRSKQQHRTVDRYDRLYWSQDRIGYLTSVLAPCSLLQRHMQPSVIQQKTLRHNVVRKMQTMQSNHCIGSRRWPWTDPF